MLNSRLPGWGKAFYDKIKAFLITRITKSVYLKKKWSYLSSNVTISLMTYSATSASRADFRAIIGSLFQERRMPWRTGRN